ncbi:ABC transporter permease subunit [Micromonospora echinospora]|uniref:ABC-2 type transport system permease protein n=1 Tax=Micromonospora echinospora TaxID=1877 RepID=A0ABR6MDG3_MICEC|nr:ABC transporter permease subunit [Micromonospora echinospora]MBB5113415.1 ABC-2 type transport system permease protein [Micromonospora echinospora]
MRSTMGTLAAVAVATVGIAVLVAATASLQPDDTILGGSLGNLVPGQIAAGALGVLVVCGEYGSGTIRATFAACPRRLTVLAAKALVVAALVFVVAFTAALCAYQAATVMLSGQGYLPGKPMPALVGLALSYAAVAVLGVALGTVLRHSAAAVAAVIGFLLLPTLIGPLLGDWQRWVAGASPVAALQKLVQTSDAGSHTLGSLGAWPTLWLVCGYSVAALAASAWLLRARDA